MKAGGKSMREDAVPRGAASFRVTGLEPASDYSGTLACGPLRQRLTLRTLGAMAGCGEAVLDSGAFRPVDVGLVATRGRIGAAWVREHRAPHAVVSEPMFRESLDGGETWGPLENVGGEVHPASSVDLAYCKDGWVASVRGNDRERGWTHLLTRPFSAGAAWHRAGMLRHGLWHYSNVVNSSESSVHLLFGGREGFRWMRFLLGGSGLDADLGLGEESMERMEVVRWGGGHCELLGVHRRPPRREVLELLGGPADGPRSPGERGWPVSLLTPEGSSVTAWGAAGLADRLLVVWEANRSQLFELTTRDGRNFEPPRLLDPGESVIGKRPAMATDAAGRCYLAIHVVRIGALDFTLQFRRFRPREGRWELLGIVPLSMLDMSDQKLVVLEENALVVASDRDRGVVSQRLPLQPQKGLRVSSL